jgi:hypothetical protein
MNHTLCLALFLSLAACATDSTSPTISDLTSSTSTMTVGQQATVGGTLTFEDPDGDLAQLAGEIRMPDDTIHAIPNADVRGVGSLTTGTLGWQMFVVPPMAGTYTLTLWVIDEEGNESNRVETTASATP